MPKNKVKRLPRNIKTVDDLLTADDVNSAISLLIDRKINVKNLIIIHSNKDGSYGTICTENLTNADLVFYMEQLKHDIFNEEQEEEE